ncbi:MAG: adenosine deaminase [Gemmatimonadales bacterium]|nr:adenosine deaminase [Gemmatimonadota bacterium]MDX2056248.1 adenosine deaminase [Gemmatimonadales bacterium]
MLTRDLIARLPKAELHVHLDGSLRPATMIELARAARFELPTTDPEALRRYMRVDDAPDLEQFLMRFEFTIPLLQTEEAIERVAYEMVEDAARDNLRYLEVRYCPKLSTRGGLTMDQAVMAEWRGLQRGERDFGVKTGIINCSLRHYDPAVSVRIAEHSVRMKDHGVVAFDLAGGEAGRMPGVHGEAFDIALRGRLAITCHAGEAAGAPSVSEAITRCHAMRLGHGTRLWEDPDLEAFVRDRRIPIEINLTSNLQTHVVTRAADHPVRRYFDAGLAVTLCTDSWLMCGVSLTDEYWLAHQSLGFDRAAIDRMILNGFEAAFLPWPEKRAMLESVAAELAAL